MLSKNQYIFLNKIKVGEKFSNKDVSKILGLKSKGLGGSLSGLLRSGYIESLYVDTQDNRNTYWKRIK